MSIKAHGKPWPSSLSGRVGQPGKPFWAPWYQNYPPGSTCSLPWLKFGENQSYPGHPFAGHGGAVEWPQPRIFISRVRGLRRLLGVQVLSAGKIGQEKGDFTFQCWSGVLKVHRIEGSGF